MYEILIYDKADNSLLITHIAHDEKEIGDIVDFYCGLEGYGLILKKRMCGWWRTICSYNF